MCRPSAVRAGQLQLQGYKLGAPYAALHLCRIAHSLIYCDLAQTEGCSAPIRGVVKVMSFCFCSKVENQPSGSCLGN